jgi:uncharacterized protein
MLIVKAAMKKNKILLDSNIWISYLLNKRLHILVEQVTKMDIELLSCQQLVDELSSVLKREKFRNYISPEAILEFTTLHIKMCLFVTIDEIPESLSDKKDNFLLALYHQGDASLFVTGDKLLLEEAAKKNINVATLAKFKELINEPMQPPGL